jgi:hypothetical protein
MTVTNHLLSYKWDFWDIGEIYCDLLYAIEPNFSLNRNSTWIYLFLCYQNCIFRGEWHTYPGIGTLSQTTKTKVLKWYIDAFKTTKLQARDPSDVPGQDIGFHDDSFAYSTVRMFRLTFL